MLRATFLGWQSWLIGSEHTQILVDPVLVDEVGRGLRGTRGRYTFWPPRRFEWSQFPSIDAVMLTHEHDDHLSIPSLARIDRRVPIFLSSLSAAAAQSILLEMGFSVQLLEAGQKVRIGEFELSVFSGDHVRESTIDEWSTLAILLRHLRGAGNFFTNVDVAVTAQMKEAVDAAGTWNGRKSDTLTYEQMSLGLWGARTAGPATPHGIAEGAEGPQFALEDEAFPAIAGGARIRPLAGQSAVLVDGRLAAVEPRASFLTWVAPPADWERVGSFWGEAGADLQPCCGRAELPDADIPELERGLRQLAEHLYARELFQRLYSLDKQQLAGRKATFAWCLLADGEGAAYVYEYRPQLCDFAPVEQGEGLEESYVGVIASWATDLVALLRGELDPRSVARGYRSTWNPPCADVAFFSQVLWPFFHPLRHPEACLRQYRAVLAEERDASILVRAGIGAGQRAERAG